MDPIDVRRLLVVVALALSAACRDEDTSMDALPAVDTRGDSAAHVESGAAGSEKTIALCTDGLDNDGDSYIDCGDANCCAVVECSSQPTSYCARHPITDGGASDGCAKVFGSRLSATYGRMDGTVRAVVGPNDAPCPRDDDHVIVQVDMGGATYKLWVNIESALNASDPLVRFLETAHALVGPPWSEGWHTDAIVLGYAMTLTVHTPQFVAMAKDQLVTTLKSKVLPGRRISIFAHGYASGDGAHLIHYNGAARDGALVMSPDVSPTYLLFQFSNQNF